MKADLRPAWLVEQLMREYGLTKAEALAVLDGKPSKHQDNHPNWEGR